MVVKEVHFVGVGLPDDPETPGRRFRGQRSMAFVGAARCGRPLGRSLRVLLFTAVLTLSLRGGEADVAIRTPHTAAAMTGDCLKIILTNIPKHAILLSIFLESEDAA